MRRPEHLDDVLLVLGELGTINIRRAYGNWAKASLKGWGQLTGLHSIIPMQQFDVVKGKSATDMRMTIDAHGPPLSRQCRRLRDHVVRQRLPAPRPAHPRGRAAGLRLRHRQDAAIVPAGLHALLRCRRAGARRGGRSSSSRSPAKASGRSTPSCCRCSARPTRRPSATTRAIPPLSELGQRAKAVSSFAARNLRLHAPFRPHQGGAQFRGEKRRRRRLLVKRLR